eukprot:CAMPEP_0171886224 /NCGR_PEP_ID=MMETSP0992-20121227/41772_1 /TAXON_ID=483369 /ORGANISM="non described non described, Strain CCMP2098" /LENGTH=46 /DNA_ID= /DNA_START= /DNA_END= /DNA_ORIENTATION=
MVSGNDSTACAAAAAWGGPEEAAAVGDSPGGHALVEDAVDQALVHV